MTDPAEDTDSENEHLQQFREWADRNDFPVFNINGMVTAKLGPYKYVKTDASGNIVLQQDRFLGGEQGEVTFHDSELEVIDEHGNTANVSEQKFPINHD